MSIRLTSMQSEMDTDMARARHYYAGSVPEEVAKALRLDWERDETDAESNADRMEALEAMIASAIRIAVVEGISNE